MATSVTSTTTSVTLLSTMEPRRRAVIIENSDANRLHILLGDGTASTTNFSFSIAQNEQVCLDDYHGTIQGVWATAGTGAAKVSCY